MLLPVAILSYFGNTRNMLASNSGKIAILFGGSGFLGKHLAELLSKNGFRILIADLLKPNTLIGEFVECDVRQEINFSIDGKPDLVVNLAAVHRTPGHEDSEYYETNIGGASNIINWCNEVQAEYLVFISSIAVYGPSSELKSEKSIPTPVSAYGMSKLLAESICRSWQQEDPKMRNLIICRPAVIFGDGENGNFARMAKAISKGLFLIPGDRNIIKSCGYVKDLASSILFTFNNVRGCFLYNFSFATETTIGEISDAMAKIGDWRKPISISLQQVTRVLLRLPNPASAFGARISKLLLSTRIDPIELKSIGFEWKYGLDSSLQDWFFTSNFDIEK